MTKDEVFDSVREQQPKGRVLTARIFLHYERLLSTCQLCQSPIVLVKFENDHPQAPQSLHLHKDSANKSSPYTTLTHNMFHTTTTSLLIAVLSILSCVLAQNAALGGGAGGQQALTQYPTVYTGPSISTNAAGTAVIATVVYTQTFKTPLGTWAFATPSAGSIGLGKIQGSVGAVRKGGKK